MLANDWDLVVHQKYLFKVPAKVKVFQRQQKLLKKNNISINSFELFFFQVTVSNIIDQYVLHLESLDLTPAKRSSATEVSLNAYFLDVWEKSKISAEI